MDSVLLEKTVFSWIVNLKLFTPSGSASKTDQLGRTEIRDKDFLDSLVRGDFVAGLLRLLMELNNVPSNKIKVLEGLKTNSSQNSILFNWNMLATVIKGFLGIELHKGRVSLKRNHRFISQK